MDVLIGLVGYAGSFLSYLIPFLFVLTIVVFFHELGHFGVARYFGTKIDVFSVGFGKEIFGWNDKHGTRWRVSWLPLGGYVKFFGDEDASSAPDQQKLKEQSKKMTAEQRAACFHFKPLPQRAAIVAAGPFANFLLAIVIFTFIFSIWGETVIPARVGEVLPDSAAEEAGIEPGDLVVTINGTKIEKFLDLQRIVSLSADTPLDLVLERGGETIEMTLVPRREELEDPFGNIQKVGLIGVRPDTSEAALQHVRYNPVVAMWKGVEETWFVIDRTFRYLGRLIIGKEDADQLGGPLRIAQMSGQVATLGLVPLINLAAILSVSIGLINLFPIPMLDGGHLLYYGYEAAAGRPMTEQAQEYGFRIGLALVLCLMVFATWNDLVNLTLF